MIFFSFVIFLNYLSTFLDERNNEAAEIKFALFHASYLKEMKVLIIVEEIKTAKKREKNTWNESKRVIFIIMKLHTQEKLALYFTTRIFPRE